jgi:arylsulfatase A-like enzyme
LPSDFENPFVGDPHDQSHESIGEDLGPARALGDKRRLGFYVAQYDANVLVADHYIGELLRHNTTAHVPLLLSYPGVVDVDRKMGLPVELVDLYPTLRELVAPEAGPADLEGDSLLPLLGQGASPVSRDGSRRGYSFSEAGGGNVRWRHYRSVQTDAWKLIFHREVDRRDRQLPASFELFHLESDPLEQENFAGLHEPEFEQLWRALSEWMKSEAPAGEDTTSSEAYSEKTLKALRALGYLD